jgi:hypothetical protein
MIGVSINNNRANVKNNMPICWFSVTQSKFVFNILQDDTWQNKNPRHLPGISCSPKGGDYELFKAGFGRFNQLLNKSHFHYK